MDFGNIVILIHPCHTEFIAEFIRIYAGIVGHIDIFMEYIVHIIVIRAEYIGIAHIRLSGVERRNIIVFVKIFVQQQLNTIFLPQILKLFSHKAYNEDDICNPSLFQLTNLPLNQHLALHLEQPLRHGAG